uniref:E3 ubiquitin-protein ligase TRIM33 isoform X2 n=1 Tax=Scatophagus argus TaxID=75038 RepID=UPI001ED85ADF|nr:E3 ubiquitin-protein ligase TRIM33 isoform X2 [Scatophagus argus]
MKRIRSVADMTSALSMDAAAERGSTCSQQCSSCDDSSARCWCVDCNEALCNTCVSAHRRVTVTRSHQILDQLPAGSVSTPPTQFCRLHPSESLKLFCLTCNQRTCRDCQLMAHMNHRYQFVSEVLDGLKKQLEDWLQPVRGQRDRVRQSLLDMETRLQDIKESESQLRAELLRSYTIICQRLKSRMVDILKEVEKVCEMECDSIQRRMQKLKDLQHRWQLVTEAARKAQSSGDLSALLSFRTQIKAQLETVADQDLSPPQTMSQLRVVTDRKYMETILNFGALEVTWIPFSVSQMSTQKEDNPAACSSSSSCRPPTQTSTTADPPLGDFCPSTSKPSSNQSSHSCLSVIQSSAVPTPTIAVVSTHPVKHPSYPVRTQSRLRANPRQVPPDTRVLCVSTSNLQPVSFPQSAGPSPSSVLLQLVQPSLVSAAPLQNQASTPVASTTLLTINQTMYQMIPVVLSQPASCSSWQKKTCGSMNMCVTTSSFDTTPPSSIRPASSCRLSSQTGTTSGTGSGHSTSQKSLSNQLCLPPSSSSTHTTCSAPFCKPLPQPSATNHRDSPVADRPVVSPLKSISTELWLPPTLSYTSSSSVTLPTSTYAASTCRLLPHTEITSDTASPVPDVHQTTSVFLPNHHLPKDDTPATGGPLPSRPDITSSSLKQQQQQSAVVREVADSACDHNVEQVTVRQQEPEENEPTSTVSEESEQAEKLSAPEEESSSVIGHPACSLSKWQPRVSLFRLPVSPTRPGCPLPGFSLVPGDGEDEIYLKEMSEDAQSDADDSGDDFTEPPSSPESPVTLQMVSCSACGAALASIVCSACGRGYHRDCHLPPVGPDIWSEWICSLCQDLSDPSDPYSTDRPQTPQRPCLSVLEQRRCESLLLHLKVEGCGRLSEPGSVWSELKLLSERLAAQPSYQSASEFVCDAWSLFRGASQDGDALKKLQRSFHSRLVQTFGSELHPSVLKPQSRNTEGGKSCVTRPHTGHQKGSEVTAEEQEVIISRPKLTEIKKRLRDFLVGTPGSKRRKTDQDGGVRPRTKPQLTFGLQTIRMSRPLTSQQPVSSDISPVNR